MLSVRFQMLQPKVRRERPFRTEARFRTASLAPPVCTSVQLRHRQQVAMVQALHNKSMHGSINIRTSAGKLVWL